MFDTIYYTKFWYSRFLVGSSTAFDAMLYQSSAPLHAVHLRLLSLFFETIYIPRTHLLTHFFDDERDYVAAAVDTDEFRFLADIGSIRISTFPDTDARGDNQRILERSSLTDEVIYASDHGLLSAIPETEKITIASLNESTKNMDQFPRYARTLAMLSADISKEALEAISRANIKDVPFFHEKFLSRLRRRLTPEHFDRVWRDTNSIYITSADPTHTGLISYFDPDIEALRFRHRPPWCDRYLFNPAVLYTYVTLLLDGDSTNRLLYGNPASALRCLLVSGHRAEMRRLFRAEYFSIARRVSAITANAGYDGLNLELIRTLFEHQLRPQQAGGIALAVGLAEDVRALGSAAKSVELGILGGLVKPGLQVAKNIVAGLEFEKRLPGTANFVKFLKSDLEDVR